MITAIIDADLILHRAASGVQSNYEWDGGVKSVSADFAAAKDKAQGLIHDYARAVSADRLVLALSDPTGNYFRKQILPSYKSHRSGTAKPILYNNLRDWVHEAYEVVVCPGLEADDVCGILSTHPTKYAGTKILCGVDKDFLSVPGLLYRPHRPKEGVVQITEAEADRAHLMQTLTGDPTDGFYGIPGIGPVKALKILCNDRLAAEGWATPSEQWGFVVAAYEKAGLPESDALTQARVAFILRHGYYHKDIGVRLWTPDGQ